VSAIDTQVSGSQAMYSVRQRSAISSFGPRAIIITAFLQERDFSLAAVRAEDRSSCIATPAALQQHAPETPDRRLPKRAISSVADVDCASAVTVTSALPFRLTQNQAAQYHQCRLTYSKPSVPLLPISSAAAIAVARRPGSRDKATPSTRGKANERSSTRTRASSLRAVRLPHPNSAPPFVLAARV